MPRKPAAPPKPYHHGRLRDALLDAAAELLASHGAHALTLREVARAAGVSHAAPYHHFASLDELLAELSARGFDALARSMEQAAQAADSRAALLGICVAYVRHARADPQRFKLMFGPLLARKAEFPALEEAAARSFNALLGAARRHVAHRGADGATKATDAAAVRLALAGWSLAHGLSHLAVDGALAGLPVRIDANEQLARELGEALLSVRA